ncbi:MAG: hypothetical protein FJ117_15935 [Deltaproteobacteria bacterium]|nr:hypothetical protein [Deltaproteobacteria bacterium]
MISKSLVFVGKLGGIPHGLFILTTSFKTANQEGNNIGKPIPLSNRKEGIDDPESIGNRFLQESAKLR